MESGMLGYSLVSRARSNLNFARGLAIRFPLLSSLTAAIIFLTICSLILGMCIIPIMLSDGLDSDAKRPPRRVSTSSIPFPPSDKTRRKKRSQFGRRPSEAASPSSPVSLALSMLFHAIFRIQLEPGHKRGGVCNSYTSRRTPSPGTTSPTQC